jgi:hypothetical protein
MAEKKGKIKLMTLKHTQFLEMGKDLFDLRVSEILERIGEENVLGVHPISYQHVDMTTREIVVDYGVVVVYRDTQG